MNDETKAAIERLRKALRLILRDFHADIETVCNAAERGETDIEKARTEALAECRAISQDQIHDLQDKLATAERGEATTKCDCSQFYFGSGDYYIICSGCGQKWALVGDQPEYGFDPHNRIDYPDGTNVGANPNLQGRHGSPAVIGKPQPAGEADTKRLDWLNASGRQPLFHNRRWHIGLSDAPDGHDKEEK